MDDLNRQILAALEPSADEDVDRTGRSTFDYLREYLHGLAIGGRAQTAVIALMDVGGEGTKRDVDWWLALLDLFEEVRVTPGLALNLSNFFQEHPPENLEARAYVIRFLAHLDAPISWDHLPAGSSLNDLASAAPLVIAESLLWAQEFDRAREVLLNALSRKWVTHSDLRDMVARWRDAFGASVRPFLDAVDAMGAAPHGTRPAHHQSGYERFAGRISGVSDYFPTVVAS